MTARRARKFIWRPANKFLRSSPRSGERQSPFPRMERGERAPARESRLCSGSDSAPELARVQRANQVKSEEPQRRKENSEPQRNFFGSSRLASQAALAALDSPRFSGAFSDPFRDKGNNNLTLCLQPRKGGESSASADAGRVNLNRDKRPAPELFKEGVAFPRNEAFSENDAR